MRDHQMRWLRLSVKDRGGNGRLRILEHERRRKTARLPRLLILQRYSLGRFRWIASGLVWFRGWHVDCSIQSRGDQVNRDVEDHGCRIIKDCGHSSGGGAGKGTLGA